MLKVGSQYDWSWRQFNSSVMSPVLVSVQTVRLFKNLTSTIGFDDFHPQCSQHQRHTVNRPLQLFVSASLQMSICLAPGVCVSYIMHVVCADWVRHGELYPRPQALSFSLAGIVGRGLKRKSLLHIVCAYANYLSYRARMRYPRKYIGGICHGCVQKILRYPKMLLLSMAAGTIRA